MERSWSTMANVTAVSMLKDPARFYALFFAFSACSWVPHWACHYYRLETNSGFRVGSWAFSELDSKLAMAVYGLLILANLVSVVVTPFRRAAALVSGSLHVALGLLHLYRVISPFRFEVFGYSWSFGASLRESLMVGSFGLFSIGLAVAGKKMTTV